MNKIKFLVVLFSMLFPVYVGSLLLSTFQEIQQNRINQITTILNK
nr:hypothetical protein [uncultured Mediterranean phage uvMED]